MIKVQGILKNKYVSIKDERYFFVSIENKRYAIPDRCPHKGGPLSLGMICSKRETIQCPWHDNNFKLSVLIKKAIPAVRVHNELIYL
jgi:nitrite reductase/ring-hydroxylating ferredoxin subunit